MHSARRLRFGPVEITFDDRVLAPRDWTVMQSDWAVELDGELPPGPMLELGCGAGHIGLAAVVRMERFLVQVDSDEAAIEMAARNAVAAGVADRVEVRCGQFDDMLRPGERFALVLADPPYVPSAETTRFPEDPPEAIDGGPDGLDGIRSSLRTAKRHLAAGGAVLLQVWGPAQARRCEPIAAENGLSLGAVRTVDEFRAVALLR